MRAVLVGDDPAWPAWSERLAAAGWSVAHCPADAEPGTGDPDAVLVSPWFAPARAAAAWAVRAWPEAAVWVVVTGPTAAMQRGLLITGAAGTLPRDPGAFALLRLRASAEAATVRPPRVEALPEARILGDPGRDPEARPPGSDKYAATGGAPGGDGLPRGTPRPEAAAGAVLDAAARDLWARLAGWRRALRGGVPAESRRRGTPWWEFPAATAPQPDRALLAVVAARGVDPCPLLAEWAVRRGQRVRAIPLRAGEGSSTGPAADEAGDPLAQALGTPGPGGAEALCFLVDAVRPPRDGVPDRRLALAAARCAAVAVATAGDLEGLRTVRAALGHLTLRMGGAAGAPGRLAVWLTTPLPRPGWDAELSLALGVPVLPVAQGPDRPAASWRGA